MAIDREPVMYCTRESVMNATDIKGSAYRAPQVDEAILAASQAVEGLCHRTFYPYTGSRTYDWPVVPDPARSFRLWLDEEVISLTSPTGLLLYPTDGPPYNRVELDRTGTTSFTVGQQSLTLTGVFGYSEREASAGTLNEALDSSEVGVDITVASGIGVGTVLRVDSERMLVTDKAWQSSAQTCTLASSNAATTVSVADGTVFTSGEMLLIDSEKVLVNEVTGNSLTVRRAVDGTALAAHAGATIYWPRSLMVSRGALGTTAATHSTSAPVYRLLLPPLVAQLTRAYAIANLLGEESGFAKTVRVGDVADRVGFARGIVILEEQVRQSGLARIARTRAV